MNLVEFNFGLYYAFGQELRVLSDTELESVKSKVGTEIYLGEIEGKHSEVYGIFEDTDFRVISCSDEFKSEFLKLFPNGYGIDMYYNLHDKE